MREFVTWNMPEPDSVNGYSININYHFSSFDPVEILKIKEMCERTFGSGMLIEDLSIKEEVEE